MNAGDVKRHEGTVVEAGNDLTLSVYVPGVSDTPLEDVSPECVTAVRWRPREGDQVVIYQRMGALRPELAFTWVGWAPDYDDDHLVPDYLDAGKVHLLSEDGLVGIALEDEADEFALPSGSLTDGAHVRLGRHDATEPVVLGAVYKDKLELILDRMIQAADALASTASTLATAVWPVSAVPTASPSLDDAATFAAAQSDASAVSAALTTLKGEIDETLSDFVFSAKTRRDST